MALATAQNLVAQNAVVVFRSLSESGSCVQERVNCMAWKPDLDSVFTSKVEGKIKNKSYCPYCKKVKQLLESLGAKFTALELDIEKAGAELQAALAEWTKQRTVPSVFIGGKHMGGSDATMAKHNAGELVPLLKEAGAL